MESEPKRNREAEAEAEAEAGSGTRENGDELPVKRARIESVQEKSEEGFLTVSELQSRVDDEAGKMPSLPNIGIGAHEQHILQQALSGEEHRDLGLSQHGILVEQVHAQSKQIEDVALKAELAANLAVQLEFCGQQAVRTVMYAHEDLGLSLLRAGVQKDLVEVANNEDESEQIFNAIKCEDPHGIDHLNRLVGSAASHMQRIAHAIGLASMGRAGNSTEEKASSGVTAQQDMIALSKSNLVETRITLKNRLEAHVEELNCSLQNAKQEEIQAHSLREEYDDVCVEVSLKRRQLTAKSMRLREIEFINLKADERKSADENNGREGAEASPIQPGVDNRTLKERTETPAGQQFAESELSGSTHVPLAELKRQEQIVIDESIQHGKKLAGDIEGGAHGIGGDLGPTMVHSNQSWYDLVFASSHCQIGSKLLEGLRLEAKRLNDQAQTFDDENLKKIFRSLAHFPSDTFETSPDTQYASKYAKITASTDAAEDAKRRRDRMSLKYEHVKLEGGKQAIAELFEREVKTLGLIEGLVDKRLSVLTDQTKALGSSDLTSSSKLIAVQQKRNDETIDDIEALSTMYSDLDAFYKRVRTSSLAKEEAVAKTLSDVVSQKASIREAEYELESQFGKYQVELQRAQIMRNQLDRERKQIEATRGTRASAVSASLQLTQDLLVAQSELEEKFALFEELQCKLVEVRKLREGLLARISRAQEDVAAEAQSLNALKLKLAASVRGLKSEQQIADRLAGRAVAVNDTDSSYEVLNPEERDYQISELRRKLKCSINADQDKEVVIVRCGHLFSRRCVDDLIASRNRKCPACHEKFGQDDVRSIFLE
ncbi:E3 ubiquitin-protein ligase BRE1-like 1 [Porphyridium purpureum]|uniref:E3 ubiquitin protein ligase n=1 Tax=Porphyridium purpureum TaxID=35688 RepID=A0A5J4Z0P8_PORPP|nr:E3 ubiquitin-protein ligase BRE1-like 1 [Porphyridium purpureum]|eukprot:POR5337..scf208_2